MSTAVWPEVRVTDGNVDTEAVLGRGGTDHASVNTLWQVAHKIKWLEKIKKQ